MNKRKATRLSNYDYSQIGLYFITICTKNKKCYFGQIVNDRMILNIAGKIIDKWWNELENKFNITLHEYVIMPNHIHGIIEINNFPDAKTTVGADLCVRPTTLSKGQTHRSVPTVSTIIQWFKTMTTNECIREVKNGNLPRFNNQIWQRSFYDHIIRKNESLNKIKEYIIINPKEWHKDKLNTNNI